MIVMRVLAIYTPLESDLSQITTLDTMYSRLEDQFEGGALLRPVICYPIDGVKCLCACEVM